MEVQIPGMQGIETGTEVKVRKPGQGERGVWRVAGEVARGRGPRLRPDQPGQRPPPHLPGVPAHGGRAARPDRR